MDGLTEFFCKEDRENLYVFLFLKTLRCDTAMPNNIISTVQTASRYYCNAITLNAPGTMQIACQQFCTAVTYNMAHCKLQFVGASLL
jgi:hypothetical protein